VPAERSYIGRCEWTVALVAAVLLATGACGGSHGPTAASSPSPVSSIDHYRKACDRINTARRDYLDVVLRAELTLDDPNATPAEIHDQADKILAALVVFGEEVLEAGMSSTDSTLRQAALDYGARAPLIFGNSIRRAGDDPQKACSSIRPPATPRARWVASSAWRGRKTFDRFSRQQSWELDGVPQIRSAWTRARRVRARDSCNLAACHGCALLPETSCEEFNRFLDRGLVIGTFGDPLLGYFSNVDL
jgi:hypothetical protein